MQNKNNTILFSVVFGILGILIGGLFFGGRGYYHGPMMMSGYRNISSEHMMDMDDMMEVMSGDLDGKTGDSFDKAFIDRMIIHHKGAVVMAEQVLQTSKRPELVQLANDIISAQTKEIEMMEGWRTTWFEN